MSNYKQATHYNYGGDGKVYDHQVASYTKKHMRLIDRFNLRKVVAATMYSFGILSGSVEEPKTGKKNWKYFRDI